MSKWPCSRCPRVKGFRKTWKLFAARTVNLTIWTACHKTVPFELYWNVFGTLLTGIVSFEPIWTHSNAHELNPAFELVWNANGMTPSGEIFFAHEQWRVRTYMEREWKGPLSQPLDEPGSNQFGTRLERSILECSIWTQLEQNPWVWILLYKLIVCSNGEHHSSNHNPKNWLFWKIIKFFSWLEFHLAYSFNSTITNLLFIFLGVTSWKWFKTLP